MTPACKAARGLAAGVAVRGVRALHAETEAVAAAMTVAPDSRRTALMDNLVAALKTAEVWPRLDALFVMAAHDAQAAGVNWIAPEGAGLTPVNGPDFQPDLGYQGDGSTSYLETGFVQASWIKYKIADHHAGVFVVGGEGTGTAFGNSRNRLQPRTSGGQFLTRSNNTTSDQRPVESGLGHSAMSRTEGERYQVFKDGVVLGTPEIANASLASQPIVLLGYGTASAPAGLTGWRLGAAHFGAGLSAAQLAVIHAALETYLRGVSAWPAAD
ncbi:MAG: hypothetical protein Q7V15_09980 [Phenylobacterium sp.]|uniref:hypothetical protein n=1 Tax=Phenylobacterium sp. TaxID=1871053 RepID=UPI0027259C79|nr:hypothetical protein [Phenylobacterium sp.]MDO8901672.1 hypothetical protein [Phenylobacterium sp.]